MPTVLGIRHGEVENPSNVIYARMPGFRLSARGREMAEQLGKRLSKAPVTAVYASPLERAQETAAAIAAPHGLEIRTDDRLIEWSFWTQWQGTPWADVRERSPETFSRYAEDPGSLHPEDSLEAVGTRVVEWAAEAAGKAAGGDAGSGIVIGVSHEAPLAAARAS
jgi:broad specificity phosphatase PhoE